MPNSEQKTNTINKIGNRLPTCGLFPISISISTKMAKQKQVKIHAERNGRIAYFPPSTWDLLPEGRYGWREVKGNAQLPVAKREPPKAVREAIANRPDPNK